MPLILFLISVLISASLFLSVFRVSQDTFLHQKLLESTAAFYTASSSADASFGLIKASKSTEQFKAFEAQKIAQKTSGKPSLSTALSSFTQTALELNQERETTPFLTVLSASSSFVPQQYYDSSAEVFLYKLDPNEVVSSIRLDYCLSEVCTTPPELIIDWFELPGSFEFQDLASLKNKLFPGAVNGCITFPGTTIKRCVQRTKFLTSSDITINTGKAPEYKKTLLFTTKFGSVSHYLFRFRTIDRSLLHFRLMGEKSSGEIVQLQNAVFEADEVGKMKSSFRRIRQQEPVSAGLQDGLEFVHFGQQVKNK